MNVNGITTGSAIPVEFSAPVDGPFVRESAAAAADHPAPPVQPEPDSAAVRRMVEEIRSQFNTMNLSLSFSTYGKNNEKISIAVVDKETGKVVREIPPKQLQQLSMKLDELIGLLFNESV